MSAESEKIIDLMYQGWLEYSGRTDKVRQHPSREEFGRIVGYVRVWGKAFKMLQEQAEEQAQGGAENDNLQG